MCDFPSDIKLFEECIEFWGIEKQLNLLTEEMGELLVAINKWRRNPCDETCLALIEELADNGLVIDQFKYHFGLNDYQQFRRGKIVRTRAKLDKQKAEKKEQEDRLWACGGNV